jgi:2-succinyl-6-hydroxy-2,4-cyclohexadiene-1-carboxylate synthase
MGRKGAREDTGIMAELGIHRSRAIVNGVEIFYLSTETKGDAILCLHGRWGRGETWSDFMRHYGGQYRVIAPDQRGHGLSGKPISRYTSEEMAGDAIALLDRLRIDSAIVVGHSMSGGIAAYLAARYPERVRALAILDKSAAGPGKPSALPLEKVEAIDPITKDWPLPFASRLEAQNYIRKAMKSDLSYQYFMNSLTEGLDGYRMMYSDQAMAANIAYYHDWFDLLPKIKCPVMLVRSGSHEAVPDEDFARMKALIPDCMAFELSHPDHNVHLANPDEFYGCFDEFLKKIGFSPNAAQ